MPELNGAGTKVILKDLTNRAAKFAVNYDTFIEKLKATFTPGKVLRILKAARSHKRRLLLGSFMLFICCTLNAQSDIAAAKIINATFKTQHEQRELKRPLMLFKKKSAYYNPFNYIGAGLLFTYQNIFSEQIQASCVYETSCSEFTKRSISELGFINGLFTGFNQWTECFAGAIYEHPAVSRNSDNKIINSPEKKDQ